ncbi:MAG: right-handed parallel beta-helix repeat-containing protein, partial [Deltaproteobacteria bacterium]|nr:right-handed parallel beta-helix repeat-containing protein [Deltaproteobacteria bacterium]
GVDCSGHGTCNVVDGAAQCSCEDGYHVVDATSCEEDTQGCVHDTDWGFVPFDIPADSVTVPPGGDIQAAIDSLSAGGTVVLKAGAYEGSHIQLKSNLVIQGAGVGVTTIAFNGGADQPLMQMREGQNVILRGFTADCRGTATANGIEFIHGPDNILIEDVEVFGADKSNLLVYNTSWNEATNRITIKNVSSYDGVLYHGIGLRFVESALVCQCESHHMGGYGLDFSRVKYAEIVGCFLHDNGSGGSKFPGSNFIYIHDSTIADNSGVGIKFNLLGTEGTGLMHFDIENTEVTNSGAGMVDWGDDFAPPTFEEMVLIGNNIHDNVSNGQPFDHVRLRGCNAAHEYGDNIGLTIARAGTINAIAHQTGTPQEDGVGWVAWPGPQ